MTMKQNLKLKKNLAFKNQIKREFEFFDDKTIESSSTRENLSNPFMWSNVNWTFGWALLLVMTLL